MAALLIESGLAMWRGERAGWIAYVFFFIGPSFLIDVLLLLHSGQIGPTPLGRALLGVAAIAWLIVGAPPLVISLALRQALRSRLLSAEDGPKS